MPFPSSVNSVAAATGAYYHVRNGNNNGDAGGTTGGFGVIPRSAPAGRGYGNSMMMSQNMSKYLRIS